MKLKKRSLSHDIPIKTEIMYLGVQIKTSLHNIVKSNYDKIFKEVQRDIAIWTKLPASLQTRIASIKMNILPCLNFMSMMIPLPPPHGYWKNLDKLLRSYIWNGKLLLYHHSFQLRSRRTWFDRSHPVAWKAIEDVLVFPYKLESVLFSGITDNQCMLRFGPVISNTIRNLVGWKMSGW